MTDFRICFVLLRVVNHVLFLLLLLKRRFWQKFNRNIYIIQFLSHGRIGTKQAPLERVPGFLWTAIIHTHSRLLTWQYFSSCCHHFSLVLLSTNCHHPTFIPIFKGPHPCSSSWSCLSPFNFSDNFLAIHFFSLLCIQQTQRCFEVELVASKHIHFCYTIDLMYSVNIWVSINMHLCWVKYICLLLHVAY